MIRKVLEEKELVFEAWSGLKQEVDVQRSRIRDLESENIRLNEHLSSFKDSTKFSFGVTLMASLLLAFGVNVATSRPDAWPGWVMVCAACALLIIVFLSASWRRR